MKFKESGRVIYYYSGTILSEMAPLQPDYSLAAEGRAELLFQFCGTNALASQDWVLKSELSTAYNTIQSIGSIYSGDGDWYPLNVFDLIPAKQEGLGSNINDVLQESGLNRATRRKAQRGLMKKGQPRTQVRLAITQRLRSQPLDDLLARLPMRLDDARILMRYYAGDAPVADATAAFRASLRDPRWMMQWFRENHIGRHEFINWLRGPAASAVVAIRKAFESARKIRALDAEFGTSLAGELITAKSWRSLQDRVLCDVATKSALNNSFSTGD